jgi:hypothetical protein
MEKTNITKPGKRRQLPAQTGLTPLVKSEMTEMNEPIQDHAEVLNVNDETAVELEIEPTAVVEQIQEEAPAPVVVRDWGVPLSARTLELLDKLNVVGGPTALVQLQHVIDYVKAMSPGKILDKREGARQQANLWRAVHAIVENNTDHFRITLTTLLMVVHDHHEGAFDYRYVFRFMEDIQLSPIEQRAFRAVMTLLLLAMPASKRAENIKPLGFERFLKEGFTDNARSRMMDYFQIN